MARRASQLHRDGGRNEIPQLQLQVFAAVGAWVVGANPKDGVGRFF